MARTAEAKPRTGMDRHKLTAAIDAAVAGSSEHRAGIEVKNQIIRGQIARWAGALGLTAAAVDALFIGWGAAHVLALPAAVTVDLLVGAGAAGLGAYGLARKAVSKHRRERATSLKDLVKTKKITDIRGNSKELRYGVVEGTWYPTPVSTGDGIGTKPNSASMDGELVGFVPTGLVSSWKIGRNVRFKGRPFEQHRLRGEHYRLTESETRREATLKYLKDPKRNGPFGLGNHMDHVSFFSGWGLNPLANRRLKIFDRAVAGYIQPTVDGTNRRYVLRVDGKKASIWVAGPNFDNDPTDLSSKPHSSTTIRTLRRDPEMIRALAMRAIVKSGNLRGLVQSNEDTPVFRIHKLSLRNFPGLLGAYRGDHVRLAETPGVRATLERRRAVQLEAEQATAAEQAAAAQRAAAEQKLPRFVERFQYVKTLVPTVAAIADSESPLIGNGLYVKGIPTTEGQEQDGDFTHTVKKSAVAIYSGEEPPVGDRKADRFVQVIKILDPDTRTVTGLKIQVWSLSQNLVEAASENPYYSTVFTYNRGGTLDNASTVSGRTPDHNSADLQQLTTALSSLQPQATVTAS